MKNYFYSVSTLFFSIFALLPTRSFAHEAYVLEPGEFQQGIDHISFRSFDALKNIENLKTFFIISLLVGIALLINIFFMRSRLGQKWRTSIEKLQFIGPLAVRVTMSIAFFFSAYSYHYLGPELSLAGIPFENIVQAALYTSSALVLLGLFSELAAFVGIIIYCLATYRYGSYMLTYFNYIGGLLMLLLIGNRFYTLDRVLFGEKKRFMFVKKYENLIVRSSFAIAMIFTTITVKFLHSDLTLAVVNNYHLTKFYLLFPHDPLLVALGSGLAELTIGVFILIGFQLRLVVLISLFYLTMSLLFFGEVVWPHLLLYGILIKLLVTKERFAFDNFIIMWKNKNYIQK